MSCVLDQSILLSFFVCVYIYVRPVYHYIAATVVYLLIVERVIAACIVVIWFYEIITELVPFKDEKSVRMLGCLEVVEYSLKERFNKKYLHHVSYLHLQDVIGVCLSYCCLSGTTPGIISAFARCNWCVSIILLIVYPVQRVYLS